MKRLLRLLELQARRWAGARWRHGFPLSPRRAAQARALLLAVVVVWAALALGRPAVAAPVPQAGTPGGLQVEVFEEVNVRAGPGTDYDLIGKLVPGQSETILGRATVGAFVWLKIVYFGGPDNAGWVLAGLVRVAGDVNTLPEVAIPPTPTLPPTATLGVFVDVTPTPGGEGIEGSRDRLPTFTAPAPVIRPTLLPAQGLTSGGGAFPPALAIIALFVMGVFAGLVSLIRSRG